MMKFNTSRADLKNHFQNALPTSTPYTSSMMKTVEISLRDLLSNYSNSIIDLIDDIDQAEKAGVAESFAKSFNELLHAGSQRVREILRRDFKGGNTMMMLNPEQFNVLETACANGEDFCVRVFKGSETIVILSKDEIMW